MKVAFIASEYNPFHNGHEYHISKTKDCGADAIVCIMSGNFVQRGDIAVASKHIRAKTALMSGADLVIELPLKYAVSTAAFFAEGFVKTAKATGLDGFFSFGAKNNIEELKTVKSIIYSAEAEDFADCCISEGINYPAAKAKYLDKYENGKYSDVLSDANNILALEYINAIDKFYPEAEYISVYRKGVMHDSGEISGNISSAGNIRRILYNDIAQHDKINNLCSIKDFIGIDTFNELMTAFSMGAFPADKQKFETMLLSRLADISTESLRSVNNVLGGLENRIINAINRNNDLESLYADVKTKAFTHSRIRQIVLNAALGITRNDIDNGISYLRILGFNDKGRALLNFMRKQSSLPIISNLSQADISDETTKRDVYLDSLAGRLFNLCLPCPRCGNPEYDTPPVYIKK